MPVVPAAILFDLGLVSSSVRPGPQDGYRACEAASAQMVPEGSVGVGTGATVGKVLGMQQAVKGGVGTASASLGDGLVLGAMAAVNAVGGVVDPETRRFGETVRMIRADGESKVEVMARYR